MNTEELTGFEIAVIGMAGRFPGADSVKTLWQNVAAGTESIADISDEDLLAAGVDPELLKDPYYIKRKGIITGEQDFDSSFFGYTPKEALLMDPQQRLFLEYAWTALEHAGYNPYEYPKLIGVFGGAASSSYLLNNIFSRPDIMNESSGNAHVYGNNATFISTRVAYKLNLRGPAISVDTACSTSLTAIHCACGSLLAGDCDMALAGGSRISIPQHSGYYYMESGIASPDGKCRAFDNNANGTIDGNGVGLVVLKRLEDALEDRDTIHGIIKGSALNNDGEDKVGFTAPSVQGQIDVIQKALAMADITPDTIGYIETHGTGTTMGDPIEFAALKDVFKEYKQKEKRCALGSIKPNIGHLDIASGVTSFIKAICALKHKTLPPMVHFTEPNKKLGIEETNFYIPKEAGEWKKTDAPRRAAVSSFGVGGTNAHVILEEMEEQIPAKSDKQVHLITLSARSEQALQHIKEKMALHCKESDDSMLPDMAYTLQKGRAAFKHRFCAAVSTTEEAAGLLENPESPLAVQGKALPAEGKVAFLCSGQGSQYINMGRGLYEQEEIFRNEVNKCFDIVRKQENIDLKDIIFPAKDDEEASSKLTQTQYAQPALFIISYALAMQLKFWGIEADSLIGHSVGEYTAACLAGVLSVEDALHLLTKRAQLMSEMPTGSMLAVFLPEDELDALLTDSFSLAAVNGPSLCVVSGKEEDIKSLEVDFASRQIGCTLLKTSHAFHSFMMDDCLEQFKSVVKTITLSKPQIPYISNVTGTWITDEQAQSPDYWANHLRQAVRFDSGMQQLIQKGCRVFIELGPGKTLSSLASGNSLFDREKHAAVSTLPVEQDQTSAQVFLTAALGTVWVKGVSFNIDAYYNDQQRRRVPLPTYAFDYKRYWVTPGKPDQASTGESKSPQAADGEKKGEKRDFEKWFYLPGWQNTPLDRSGISSVSTHYCLLFTHAGPIHKLITAALEERGYTIIHVEAGTSYKKKEKTRFVINPANKEDYENLITQVKAYGKVDTIIHLWNVTGAKGQQADFSYPSYYSLIFLAQVLGKNSFDSPISLYVLSDYGVKVSSSEQVHPGKGLITGPVKVIPLEYSDIFCKQIDVVFDEKRPASKENRITLESIFSEIEYKNSEPIVALRSYERYTPVPVPVSLPPVQGGFKHLKDQGVYLITGGLGGIGLICAQMIAGSIRDGVLILTSRSLFPEEADWDRWLSDYKKDNKTSKRINFLRAIQGNNNKIIIIQADVSDLNQMKKKIAPLEKKYGKVSGIIHTAGIADGALLERRTMEDSEKVLAAKVQGTMVLDTLFMKQKPDFFVLCSSLASYFGPLGQVGYCSGNAFLDQYAQSQSANSSTAVATVNWDAWQEVGMAVDTVQDLLEKTGKSKTTSEKDLLAHAIRPAEGIEALNRILHRSYPQVFVCTRDIELYQSTTGLFEDEPAAVPQSTEPETKQEGGESFERPDLSTDYRAPSGEMEELIASIWSKELGIKNLGVDDNFFELGGNSLVGIQVVTNLRRALNRKIPIGCLYDNPTIAGMCSSLKDDSDEDKEDRDIIEI